MRLPTRRGILATPIITANVFRPLGLMDWYWFVITSSLSGRLCYDTACLLVVMVHQNISTRWSLPSIYLGHYPAWWRHQMETISALLAICAGNSPVPGEFPAQRPVTRSFDVFFDLCLNKRLRKQSRGWWFETLSCPLWRHRNGVLTKDIMMPCCIRYRVMLDREIAWVYNT